MNRESMVPWYLDPSLLLPLLALFLAAVVATGLARRYALSRALLDMPSARSSHFTPIPRGGGVSLLLVIGAAVYAGVGLGLAMNIVAGVIGAGILVAFIGWIDDHGHVSPAKRVLVHACAAGWALYCLGGITTQWREGLFLDQSWAGVAVALFGIVWFINLYNFMDGIDGLAGGQAVTAGVTGGLLLIGNGHPGLGFVSLSVAAAAAGFLVWNWPPARIFMGDVGSGFLGAVFAVLALASEITGALPLVAWLVLLAVFIVDATCTLVQRLFTGRRWYTAHRSHVYQRLVQAGWSHGKVTVSILALNIFVLAPVAWGVAAVPEYAPILFGTLFLGLSTSWWVLQRRYPVQ